MKLGVVSNCQALGIARSAQVAVPGLVATAMTTRQVTDIGTLNRFDLLLVDAQTMERIQGHPLADRAVVIPRMIFGGFHPDLIYLSDSVATFKGPLGDYHSAIAFAAHRAGLSVDDTVALFTRASFEELGYLRAWAPARDDLLATFTRHELPIDDLFYAWSRTGVFMHSINHPSIRCLSDLTAAALRRHGLDADAPVGGPPDQLARHAIWPVYPEIGERIGVLGSYGFKARDGSILTLKEFVERSHELYAGHPALRPMGAFLPYVERATALIGEA